MAVEESCFLYNLQHEQTKSYTQCRYITQSEPGASLMQRVIFFCTMKQLGALHVQLLQSLDGATVQNRDISFGISLQFGAKH